MLGISTSDYYPKYLIKATEEAINKYYNPETQTLALPSTPEPLFERGMEYKTVGLNVVPVSTPEPILPRPNPEAARKFEEAFRARMEEPVETKTYKRHGQKIEMEITPITEPLPISTPTPIAQPAPTPIIEMPAAPAIEMERPIAAFAGQTKEDQLRAMADEIMNLKQEQENLKGIRDMKLERLKLKWHNIAASIRAKHPVITTLIERAAKAAPKIGRAAVSAGKSFAQGLGNLATKIADPYARQGFANSLDYMTGGFAPEAGQPAAQPPALQATRPMRPMASSNNELERESERLRLQNSILRQSARLKNTQAILKGQKPPYPEIPAGSSGIRKRHKSIRSIVAELEKVQLEKELNRERKLATA